MGPLIVLGFEVGLGELLVLGSAAYQIVGIAPGASAAAFAKADEVWVTDPPGISEQAFNQRDFSLNGGFFVTSVEARAFASSPVTESKVTAEAKSRWNGFRYEGSVPAPSFEPGSTEAVLLGAGFARGTDARIVRRLEPVAETSQIPIEVTYRVPRLVLFHQPEGVLTTTRIVLRARAEPAEGPAEGVELWDEVIFEATATLLGTDFSDIEVEGDLSASDFGKIELDQEGNSSTELEAPIERTARLMVPFPVGEQAVRIMVDGDISVAPEQER